MLVQARDTIAQVDCGVADNEYSRGLMFLLEIGLYEISIEDLDPLRVGKVRMC